MTHEKQPTGIGPRLKAARERRGWSREELAVKSGLSWSAIAQVETGRRTNLRPATLAGLAQALGVTVDYLLGCGRREHGMLEHHALVYSSEEEFGAAAGGFLQEGAENGEPTLAVTTARNVDILREQLGGSARKVDFADATEWYNDPAAALAAYRAFADRALQPGVPWIRVLGEPVWSGRPEPEVRLWTRYEALLNLAFADLPMTLLCPYDASALDSDIVEHARLTHRHTVAHGAIESNPDYTDPAEFVLGF
jgi:transcriptional regulator with XRE-family HTH domain